MTPPADQIERTILVALETPEALGWKLEESLHELQELVKTAGGKVVEVAVQKLDSPTAPHYIGKGKAEELAKRAKSLQVKTIVFDDELTPAQTRNLEKIMGCKILDRTQLILDIFAQRAKTREGKLQIELAQLQYLLPRLTRMWTHLSRQTGGIGTRGPGETQLEVDRRRIQEKITRCSRDLEEVRKNRDTQRRGRMRQHWPICALVGYTNAGKSTLLNALTDSDIYAADQLFATLDPTIRQFHLPNKQKVLFVDTVGFLQKLPTQLIESFRATLEEVNHADILLHVVDASHPQFEEQVEAVNAVLRMIEANNKQTLMVFNKTDKLDLQGKVQRLVESYPNAVAISAKTGDGLDNLFDEMEKMLKSWRMQVHLRIPQDQGKLIAELHHVGRILCKEYVGNDILVVAHIPPHVMGTFKPYFREDTDENQGHAAVRTSEGTVMV